MNGVKNAKQHKDSDYRKPDKPNKRFIWQRWLLILRNNFWPNKARHEQTPIPTQAIKGWLEMTILAWLGFGCAIACIVAYALVQFLPGD